MALYANRYPALLLGHRFRLPPVAQTSVRWKTASPRRCASEHKPGDRWAVEVEGVSDAAPGTSSSAAGRLWRVKATDPSDWANVSGDRRRKGTTFSTGAAQAIGAGSCVAFHRARFRRLEAGRSERILAQAAASTRRCLELRNEPTERRYCRTPPRRRGDVAGWWRRSPGAHGGEVPTIREYSWPPCDVLVAGFH